MARSARSISTWLLPAILLCLDAGPHFAQDGLPAAVSDGAALGPASESIGGGSASACATCDAEGALRTELNGSAAPRPPTTEHLSRRNEEVRDLIEQRQYESAVALAEEALTAAESSLGVANPTTVASLDNLAEIYRALGRYADAERTYRKILAVRELALGPAHPEIADRLDDLAWACHSQGHYAEAEPLYKKALAIRKNTFGPAHPDVGASLNNLAVLYHRQDRYGEAESLYQRALGITEKALGAEHPDEALGSDRVDVATILDDLAWACHSQGHYAEAEPLYKKALAIRKNTFGPAHPDVGASLNNLAVLYSIQGRYADAEPLYERALAISCPLLQASALRRCRAAA